MDIKKAFDLWVEITGVNPVETRIRLRDMDIHRANRILSQSLEFDPSYVTTLMLMNTYLEDFLKDRQVSLKEMVDDVNLFTNWIAKINHFKSLINSEEVIAIKRDFKDSLNQAFAHYGVGVETFKTIVENEDNLAELRFSAFHAVSQLEVVQFSHGRPSLKKPRVYRDVYVFKDINTLIKWMMSVESGIVLAMIQDINDLSNSYFVFAVRNGGTLSIITDRERFNHPLQAEKSRSRARGRGFYERITHYHFPYSVMEVEFGDNHRAYVTESETSLISKEEGISLKKIKDLEHDEVVWLVLMYSLLEEKFFNENYQTPEIAYTAQMMVEKKMLLEQAEKNEVMIADYIPLKVEPLTTESMKTENLMDNFDCQPTGQHDWMIERYDVPEVAFQVATKEKTLLLDTNEKVRVHLASGQVEQQTIQLALKTMNNSSFASPEKLKRDRLYLARYNQAMVINEKVQEEYRQRNTEVKEWFREAVQKNLPNLLKAVAENSFIASKDAEEARVRKGAWERMKTGGNILNVNILKGEDFYGFTFCNLFGESTDKDSRKYTCVQTDASATLVGHFYPRTASQLADLCGCEAYELHELLQHWKMESLSPGNSILDSVDPMDWAIRDPWEKLRMDVRVYLSKKEYNRLCKEHGTGNEGFWLREKAES